MRLDDLLPLSLSASLLLINMLSPRLICTLRFINTGRVIPEALVWQAVYLKTVHCQSKLSLTKLPYDENLDIICLADLMGYLCSANWTLFQLPLLNLSDHFEWSRRIYL